MDKCNKMGTNLAHVPTLAPSLAPAPPPSTITVDSTYSTTSTVTNPLASNQANVQTPTVPAWMCTNIAIHPQARDLQALCNKHSTFIQRLEELDLQQGLMLDSGTTTSIITHHCFVQDIWPSNSPLPVNTNGSGIEVRHKGIIGVLPELPFWFFKDGMANIITMADIKDSPYYDIDYNKHCLIFTVTDLHTRHTFKFVCTSTHCLYMYYPEDDNNWKMRRDKLLKDQCSHVNTVKDNSLPYTKWQQKRQHKPEY